MDQTGTGTTQADPLEHPLYRVAHLHGTEWVTLRPVDQHSTREEDASRPWAGARLYECPRCEETVAIAPH
jgi:hypothetical protein